MTDPYDILGIPEDADRRAIKRAYAKALKQIDPDTQIEAFQRLRHAYELALDWLHSQQFESQQFEPEESDEEWGGESSSVQPDFNWPEPETSEEFEDAEDSDPQMYISIVEVADSIVMADEPVAAFYEWMETDLGLDIEFRERLEWSMIHTFADSHPPRGLLAALYLEFEWHDVLHPIHNNFPELAAEGAERAVPFLARRYVERLCADPKTEEPTRTIVRGLLSGEGEVKHANRAKSFLRGLKNRFGEDADLQLNVPSEWEPAFENNEVSGSIGCAVVLVGMLSVKLIKSIDLPVMLTIGGFVFLLGVATFLYRLGRSRWPVLFGGAIALFASLQIFSLYAAPSAWWIFGPVSLLHLWVLIGLVIRRKTGWVASILALVCDAIWMVLVFSAALTREVGTAFATGVLGAITFTALILGPIVWLLIRPEVKARFGVGWESGLDGAEDD